jgi:predicted GNAT superfamily acetyltransferase
MEGECPVPLPILVGINNNGGLVEIAIDDGSIIGFSLAFPGREGHYSYLYSHMAGVLPEFRNRDIGYQIKMHQFKEAGNMGYNEIRWTFDPMKARNSYFNVHKLKAFAYDYKINYYGYMESRENKGVESDRIEAHKFLDRIPLTGKKFNIASKIEKYPFPWDSLKIDADSVGIEIPSSLDDAGIELKRKWRLAIRNAIVELESRKYVMTDVIRNDDIDVLVFTLREKSGLQ